MTYFSCCPLGMICGLPKGWAVDCSIFDSCPRYVGYFFWLCSHVLWLSYLIKPVDLFQEENRYKVPKGTKFYRVKVRPVIYSRDAMIRSSHHHRHHQQQQQADATEAQRSVDVAKSCGVQLVEATDPSGTAASGENPVKPETEDGEAPSAAR